MKISSVIASAAVACVVALQAWTLNEIVSLKVATERRATLVEFRLDLLEKVGAQRDLAIAQLQLTIRP